MKTVPWLAFLLLFVHSLAAFAPTPVPQAPRAPIAGATVQTFFHSPGDNQMTVRVTNSSRKNLTAYILSVHTIDANGQSNDFHIMRDFLANQMFLARFAGTEDEAAFKKQAGPSFLTPGENYDEVSGMPANTQDFSVLITAVAYSDKSAEAISQQALEPLIQQREAEATSIAKANEIISASSDPQAAIAKIQNLRDIWKVKPHAKIEMNEHTLDTIIQDLQGNPADLKAYQAKRAQEGATWADQAQLKLGGAS